MTVLAAFLMSFLLPKSQEKARDLCDNLKNPIQSNSNNMTTNFNEDGKIIMWIYTLYIQGVSYQNVFFSKQ